MFDYWSKWKCFQLLCIHFSKQMSSMRIFVYIYYCKYWRCLIRRINASGDLRVAIDEGRIQLWRVFAKLIAMTADWWVRFVEWDRHLEYLLHFLTYPQIITYEKTSFSNILWKFNFLNFLVLLPRKKIL